MTTPVLGSPLLAASEGEDSPLQAALRGGPRGGEDWQAQSLVEVCLQRIAEAGFLGAASREDMRGNRLIAVTDSAGHRLAAAMVYALAQDNWAAASTHRPSIRPDTAPAQVRTGRLLDITGTDVQQGLLNVVVHNLAVQPDYIQSLAALFAEPYDDTWLPRERLNTCLGLWWGARMAEGHSAESAETMLALMSHPSVTAQFAWHRDDGCPQLRASS